MTWLVPEITLLTAREMTDPEEAWRLSRAVVVPQPPVNSRVISLDEEHYVIKGEDGVGGGGGRGASAGGGGGESDRKGWDRVAQGLGVHRRRRRPFRFSLVGGIINAERRRLVDALRDRSDTFARMQCREGRFESIDMVRSSE